MGKLKTKRPNAISFASRAAAFTPKTANETDRSVDVTIATESPAFMYDYRYGEVDEVLLMSGMRYPEQIPLLNAHNRGSVEDVLGSVRNITVSGAEAIGKASFSVDAEKAWSLVRDGHLTDFSAGYSILTVRYLEPNEVAVIDGREFKAGADRPLRIALDWKLKELSAVPIGADENAKARSEMVDDVPEADDGEPGVVVEENKEIAMPQETKDAPAVDIEKERAEAAREAVWMERERMTAIRSEASGLNIPEAEVAKMIERGITLDEARSEFLAHVRKQSSSVNIITKPEKESGDSLRQAEIALVAETCGQEFAAREYGAKEVDAASGIRGSDIDCAELCRMALEKDGKRIPKGYRNVVREAFSTMSLPNLLGAVANKSMLKGYEEYPSTWSSIAEIVDVNNFQTQTAMRPTSVNRMSKVGAGGEIKHTTMDEGVESYKVATYAEMLGVTREQIINDDLGAFTTTPMSLGRDAKVNESDLFYTHLLANGTLSDGYALCGTDHVNYISGTDTAMSASFAVGAIDAALAKFLKMTDKGGKVIGVQPSFLLVPPEVASVAESVYKSSVIVAGASTRTPNVNVHAGRYQVVVEPRLSISSFTGYSTTAWYMLSAPNMLPVMRVAYLRGQRAPVIERDNAPFNTLGIQFRCYHDFGVKAIDYRGIVKSKGAS